MAAYIQFTSRLKSTTQDGILAEAQQIAVSPTDNTNLKTYIDNKVSAGVSAAYRPKGSVTFAGLSALTSASVGDVYNVTDSFTLNGKKYAAGSNVACLKAFSAKVTPDETYWDVLGGFIDLSPYALASDLTKAKTDLEGSISNTNANVALVGKRLDERVPNEIRLLDGGDYYQISGQDKAHPATIGKDTQIGTNIYMYYENTDISKNLIIRDKDADVQMYLNAHATLGDSYEGLDDIAIGKHVYITEDAAMEAIFEVNKIGTGVTINKNGIKVYHAGLHVGKNTRIDENVLIGAVLDDSQIPENCVYIGSGVFIDGGKIIQDTALRDHMLILDNERFLIHNHSNREKDNLLISKNTYIDPNSRVANIFDKDNHLVIDTVGLELRTSKGASITLSDEVDIDGYFESHNHVSLGGSLETSKSVCIDDKGFWFGDNANSRETTGLSVSPIDDTCSKLQLQGYFAKTDDINGGNRVILGTTVKFSTGVGVDKIYNYGFIKRDRSSFKFGVRFGTAEWDTNILSVSDENLYLEKAETRIGKNVHIEPNSAIGASVKLQGDLQIDKFGLRFGSNLGYNNREAIYIGSVSCIGDNSLFGNKANVGDYVSIGVVYGSQGTVSYGSEYNPSYTAIGKNISLTSEKTGELWFGTDPTTAKGRKKLAFADDVDSAKSDVTELAKRVAALEALMTVAS